MTRSPGRQIAISAIAFVILAFCAPGTARAVEQFPRAKPESVGIKSDALRAIGAEVQGYVDRGIIIGGEVLVVKNRRTVFHEGFGFADREDKRPMRPGTICNVRSMTKSLTAAALHILAHDGKLSLDDPVARHLPAFDTDKARTVTIRQLLTHRAGLPLTILTSISEFADLQAMAEAVGKKGPDVEPGSKFVYSDAGYDTAGAVVEKVSGQPVDRFVTERILKPLGMSDSVYPSALGTVPKDRIGSMYLGRLGSWSRGWRASETSLYPFAWGSQTLYSTCADYARFLAMMMDGGKVGGRQVLSRQATARMLAPVSRMAQLGSDEPMPTMSPDEKVFYGEGMILHGMGDEPAAARIEVFGHSGSDGTVGWVWPKHDLIICFFTQTRGQPTTIRLKDTIDRNLLRPRATGPPAPASVRGFLGTYWGNFAHYRNAEFRVLWRDGALALDVPDQLIFKLRDPDAEGKRRFEMTGQVAVTFVLGPTGKTAALKLHQGTTTYELPREKPAELPSIRLDEVKKLLGTYTRPEDDGIVEVVFEEGELRLKIKEAPVPLAVDRVNATTWRMRISPTTIVFDTNDAGEVVSFTSHAPDGKKLVRPKKKE